MVPAACRLAARMVPSGASEHLTGQADAEVPDVEGLQTMDVAVIPAPSAGYCRAGGKEPHAVG